MYKTLNSGGYFIKQAAPIIFTVTVIIWFLGYFPANGELQSSYLAMAGRIIEPVFEPMGVDWRYGVAILLSFLAREVFVGVLGTLFSYVIALQCVATVATLKGVTGKNRYSWGVFVAYGLLAYIISVALYAVLS